MKDIPGYEGLYFIDEYGVIMSYNYRNKNWKIIKHYVTERWYSRVKLQYKSISKNYFVHRLVATVYIDNPANHNLVMHLDNNPRNNHVSNLKWWTQKENMRQCISDWRYKFCDWRHLLWCFWSKHPRSKPVVQYAISGEIIREYSNSYEANRELDINSSTISACCRWKRKTAWWFKWKYKS